MSQVTETDDASSPPKGAAAAETTTTPTPALTCDADLIRQAEELYKVLRYFLAADLLNQVSDQSLLEPKHCHIQSMAAAARQSMQDVLQPAATSGWKKQGESHGHRDTMVHYKVHDDNSLVCRIETPIESSLLVPLLSVFNESTLYDTWMPRWKVPSLGVKKSVKLAELGIGHQVVQVVVDMPFPFANRECIQHAFAVDSIDADNFIFIKVKTLDTGNHMEEIDIEAPKRGIKRIDLDAGILIQSCPTDHYLLQKSKANYPADEKLLLITVTQQVDAHVAGIPLSMINFFTRTVLGRMWGSLLEVAEGVRDGKRPVHQKAIAEQPELYEWVAQRVEVLFDNMEKEAATKAAVSTDENSNS